MERERARRKPPDNLDAWGLYQRGLTAFHSSTEEGLRSAIEQFHRVNEIDPTFAPAFAMATKARCRFVLHFEPHDRGEYLNQAREKAYKAITLDPRDPLLIIRQFATNLDPEDFRNTLRHELNQSHLSLMNR